MANKIKDPDDDTMTYNGLTYTLTTADVGKYIGVVVSYGDGSGVNNTAQVGGDSQGNPIGTVVAPTTINLLDGKSYTATDPLYTATTELGGTIAYTLAGDDAGRLILARMGCRFQLCYDFRCQHPRHL